MRLPSLEHAGLREARRERRRVLLIGPSDGITAALAQALRESPGVAGVETIDASGPPPADLAQRAAGAVVVLRPPADRRRSGPDLAAAEVWLAAFAALGASAALPEGAAVRPEQAVLLSSAAVVEPRHDHPGLIDEARQVPPRANAVAQRWVELERIARRHLAPADVPLLVLRPVPVASPDAPELHVRRLAGRLAPSTAGFDPSIQLLALADLAVAVRRAVETGGEGVFFVAPAGTVPLRSAIRLAGAWRLPVPHELRSPLRRAGRALGRAGDPDELAWARHPATVSGAGIARALGFVPRQTSAQAAAAGFGRSIAGPGELDHFDDFDDFGMDRGYIARYGRTLFRFLHRRYWRVETRGLEHVPRAGPAVLVGVHRGFMPWDGVMALQTLAEGVGRIPRFLIHPALVKFPFLASYMTKLGGIMACQENAAWVLARGELLGVFPEGIHGAFTPYRDAYRLGRAWRDDAVRMALRHGAPIVPFVTVGSAEIYPILGRVDWKWWKRLSGWPYLPLGPNFPVPGLPLPSKWHTLFLPPIPAGERHPPEAAGDPAVVAAVGREVRAAIEEAMVWMLARRKSIFRGSIFDGEEEGGRGRPTRAAAPGPRGSGPRPGSRPP